MKNTKKIFASLLLIITIICGVNLFGGFSFAKATADNNIFSPEQYTDSDYLLKKDGKASDKKISRFALEVKSGKNTYYPELAEVIPRQYLESKEKNATFAYNGKEYGFYVVKSGENFDVLLIDFVYEFDDDDKIHNSDVEFVIRIKPLLQQKFIRVTDDNGNYTWYKSATTTKYYVANPRFATMVSNENALNYGDSNYDKIADNGVIISQFRANYGKIAYATEKDLAKTALQFTGEKMLDFAFDAFCDGLNVVTYGIGGSVLKILKSYGEFGLDLYETGKEEVILTDNEKNIKTQMSREAQRNDSSLAGYSRAAAFAAKEEIILSEDNNSYAEFITVLSDSDSTSRLYQYCDFDIVKRDDDYSSMEYVAGNDDDRAFTFSKERILYDKTYSLDKNTMPYYLLANGKQTFKFIPKYNGKYNIKSNNSAVNISIDGVLHGSFADGVDLERGKTYNISFTSTKKTIGIGNIEVKDTNGTISIPARGVYVRVFTPQSTGVYVVSAQYSQMSVYTDIFGSNAFVASGTNDELLVMLQAGETYYLVAENKTASVVSTTILANKAEMTVFKVNESKNLSCKANVASYCQFEVTDSDRYDFAFYGDDLSAATISITASDGRNIDYDKGSDDGCVLASTGVLNKGVYFISIRNTKDSEISCVANRNTANYIWKINGAEYTNGGVRRGATYTLELLNEYGESLSGRVLMVEKTYSDSVALEKVDSGYKMTISGSAKIFIDNLTYYCTIYVKDRKDIELSFPVIFQYEDLKLKGVSLSEFDNIPKISLKKPTGGAENAKIYCSYNFDGGATIEDCIDSKTNSKNDLTKLKNYSDTYLNIRDFTIKYIELYNGNTMTGKVYNGRLAEYSGKINKTYAEKVNIGIHFESGTGTTRDPFIIDNFQQFNHIKCMIKNGELNYSFFVNSANFWGANYIPMFDCTFNGTFDGNNYEIRKESTATLASGNKALFEKIGKTGVVKNLNLVITYNDGVNSNCCMAALAIENYGEIRNSRIVGNFNENGIGTYTGVAVAKNHGTITDCELDGMICGGQYIGGIAGYNNGTIRRCNYTGYVSYYDKYTDNDYIGGIVGYCDGGTISGCNFSGKLIIGVKEWDSRTYQPYVGGIVGGKSSSATLSSNTFSGTLDVEKLNPDVTWKTWIVITNHFNQRGNVNEYN